MVKTMELDIPVVFKDEDRKKLVKKYGFKFLEKGSMTAKAVLPKNWTCDVQKQTRKEEMGGEEIEICGSTKYFFYNQKKKLVCVGYYTWHHQEMSYSGYIFEDLNKYLSKKK